MTWNIDLGERMGLLETRCVTLPVQLFTLFSAQPLSRLGFRGVLPFRVRPRRQRAGRERVLAIRATLRPHDVTERSR